MAGIGVGLDRSLIPWAIVAGALVVGVALGRPTPTAEPPVAVALPGQVASGSVTVHVSGWVVAPGLVELDEGGRVADALALAGGLRPGAVPESINLARAVVDGMRIHVEGPGGGSPVETDDGRIAINRAGASEIESLPGVGPVLAERIVAHREKHGPFETAEDLLDVPGIGEAKLDSIRDLIAVP